MAKDLTVKTPEGTLDGLVRRVENLMSLQASDPHERILVALAGVPGSGKSTVSNALGDELTSHGIQDVVVIPMDGFHYTKQVLSTFADADNAFRRRGAPFTFDAEAFLKLVAILKATPVTTREEPEAFIPAPSFDHATKDPIKDGISISSQTRLVIVEGNYTLLDDSPWRNLARYWTEKWFVDAPVETVRSRLANRHLAAGIETTLQAAVQRAEENDIPNGATIRAMLIKPDIIIEN